jgi:AcrR family transcriptional regulator
MTRKTSNSGSAPAPRPAQKTRRRTQAERSAATRSRLIETAIRCLHSFGYAATTTVLVAEEARVSRGAMLHQFATKVDLMLAVVEFADGEQMRRYTENLAARRSSRGPLHDLLDVAWEVMREPSAMAFYEIWLATRSDAELAARFGPLYERIKNRSLVQMERLMATAGVAGDRKTVEAVTRLHVAALRGLAIEWTMERNPKRLEDAIALLHDYMDSLVARRSG